MQQPRVARVLVGILLLVAGALLVASCSDSSESADTPRAPGEAATSSDTKAVPELPIPTEAFIGRIVSVTEAAGTWEVEVELDASPEDAFVQAGRTLVRAGFSHWGGRPDPGPAYHVSREFSVDYTVGRGTTTSVTYEISEHKNPIPTPSERAAEAVGLLAR